MEKNYKHIPLVYSFGEKQLREIVKTSHSYQECLRKMGYRQGSKNAKTKLKERIEEYNIDTSHFSLVRTVYKLEDKDIFVEQSATSQDTLRKHYKAGNYTPYICSICGQEPIWQGKPLTLILDHINGNNKDNRLENLRWVCPNCNY